jgi:hypothetical protein
MCSAPKPPPVEQPPPPPSERDEDIIARENRVTRARAALRGGSVQSTLGNAGTSGSAAPATVQKPTLGV